MNITERSSLVIGLTALAGTFLLFAPANAAQITLSADSHAIVSNQSVRITVQLDTQGEDANAIQAEVTFPADLFKLKKISDGSSAVSLWITPPKESVSGVIDFAGIMPGGFIGSNGPLFTFELQPLASGTGIIQIASATVLANDGIGSSLSVATGSVSIDIRPASSSSASLTPSAPTVDFTAPNPFTPEIASDPNIFNGKYFLVFAATDNASGIDHYEVLEGSSWHTATSPYLLTDQSLSGDIYVRAVDHDGNFIVVKIPARHPLARRNLWLFLTVGILIVALVLLLSIWMKRRRPHI
jgi:hypothetical protein